MKIRHVLSSLLCALGVLSSATSARAQDKYPEQPVKLMVALPAGGGVDMIARLVAQKLTVVWGQPVLVDNRAGGSGQIGLQHRRTLRTQSTHDCPQLSRTSRERLSSAPCRCRPPPREQGCHPTDSGTCSPSRLASPTSATSCGAGCAWR